MSVRGDDGDGDIAMHDSMAASGRDAESAAERDDGGGDDGRGDAKVADGGSGGDGHDDGNDDDDVDSAAREDAPVGAKDDYFDADRDGKNDDTEADEQSHGEQLNDDFYGASAGSHAGNANAGEGTAAHGDVGVRCSTPTRAAAPLHADAERAAVPAASLTVVDVLKRLHDLDTERVTDEALYAERVSLLESRELTPAAIHEACVTEVVHRLCFRYDVETSEKDEPSRRRYGGYGVSIERAKRSLFALVDDRLRTMALVMRDGGVATGQLALWEEANEIAAFMDWSMQDCGDVFALGGMAAVYHAAEACRVVEGEPPPPCHTGDEMEEDTNVAAFADFFKT